MVWFYRWARIGVLMACACSTSSNAFPTPDEVGGGDPATTGSQGPASDGAAPDPAMDGGATPQDAASSDGSAPDASGQDGSEPSLDDLVRLNHLQLKGTHNSYHIAPVVPLDDSHRYTQPSIEAQLADHHVRAFELDLHRSGDTIEVYHLTIIDSRSHCSTFRDCLTTMRDWSVANPGHLPLIVWLEIKDSVGGDDIENLNLVEQDIAEVFDDTQLITPEWLAGDYASPRARIDAEGWPTLREVRDRALFVALNQGDHTEDHVAVELAGKRVFVKAEPEQYGESWGVITKIDDPANADAIRTALEAGLLVASNTCGIKQSDAECQAKLDAALANGSSTLHDDVPAKLDDRDYWLQMPGGGPVACNPITAGPECDPALLGEGQ